MNQMGAFRASLQLAFERGMDSKKTPDGMSSAHLREMYYKLNHTFMDPSPAKLGRWLGWAQACVVAAGCATLEEMKEINKRYSGDEEPPEFCSLCAGPYVASRWLMEQYGGHWDTCPNRPKAEPEDLEDICTECGTLHYPHEHCVDVRLALSAREPVCNCTYTDYQVFPGTDGKRHHGQCPVALVNQQDKR